MIPTMEFVAEIAKVSSRKLVSLDLEYTVMLRTHDSSVLDLGKLPPDELVVIKVSKDNNTS
jgi:hypothetical protein